ncbi:MAG: CRISPR-associated endonuclease Cas2 [Candidatus Thermoplasmatota archaeon]|nr:CRISPR-associated endonuclease Cas2 [Candidatus Thermoplasmatota archaeon]MBU4071766.1 CRISPR-associated endonuclease Cas2 [Candidatus Thermoplasmatota archaeon]MBU4591279.1 CRISPR-associated endonuclease Cas2 [Candidatus Thermoplasmatota archaeon]
MYVVVVYDADSHEREIIRAILMRRLHWIQNSVFAGEVTQVAAKDLRDSLTKFVQESKVTFWMFDRKPDTFQIGTQDDEESIFM